MAMTRPGALLALHGAVLLFGFAGLFGKWLALSPLVIVFGRALVAAGALRLLRRSPGEAGRWFGPRVIAAGVVLTAAFWAAEAGHRVAHTTVHVHGGVGIDMDHPVHRYFITAKQTEFALGGASAQLRAIGRELADAPA